MEHSTERELGLILMEQVVYLRVGLLQLGLLNSLISRFKRSFRHFNRSGGTSVSLGFCFVIYEPLF